jgi:hypothetical protein
MDLARRISIRRHRVQASGRRRNAAAAATAGNEWRRACRRDPHLGFLATVWDTDDLYAKRVGQRIDLGRRSQRRRGGAGAQRGSTGHELWRGFYGVAGARDRNQLHGTAPYLLAQLRECSLTAKRRRQREPEGGRRVSWVGGPGGGGRLIKAWGGPLVCGPRTGRSASLGLGGGDTVRGGDGRS